MQWTTQMTDAINYIEENLTGDIDEKEIAKLSCCPPDTFNRIFSFIYGITLSEYIRNRRLTLAALELKNSSAKLLDIAIKYGYNSHEAFSRAFQKFHGVTPSAVRNENASFKHCCKAVEYMHLYGNVIILSKNIDMEKGFVMNVCIEPRIENRQFNLVGICRFYKWGDDLDSIVKESEAELQSRIGEIKYAVNPAERIKYFYSESGMNDGFYYLECVEVTDINDLPDGLSARTLARSDFAIFCAAPGTGGEYARNTWLPQSGYRENFELFGDLEITNIETGTCEFWLPVIKNNFAAQ